MSVRRFDTNGWFEVDRNPISRVGVFPYLGRQIGAPKATAIYYVLRPPEELGAPDCINSFRLLPFVDEHAGILGSKDAGLTPAEEHGVHGFTGERLDFDGRTLFSNLKVISESLRDDIDAGKKEVSAGYRCTYDFTPGVWEGQHYDAVQRVIRGNHLALVQKGRMGPEIAVLDHYAMDAKDAQDMDPQNPELMQKALAAAQALVAVLSELASGAATAPAAAAPPAEAAGDAPPPAAAPAAAPAAEGEKPAAPAPAAEGKKPAAPAAGAKPNPFAKKGEDENLPAPAGDETPISGEDGMRTLDEATAEIARLTKENADLKAKPSGMDEAGMIATFAARDRLADRLKGHIGTFDHAAMTLTQVAAYGVEKVGLKDVPAGSEAVALDAYMTAKGDVTRTAAAAAAATHSAEDGAAKPSFVDRHINGASA